jgi:hypothetical protein
MLGRIHYGHSPPCESFDGAWSSRYGISRQDPHWSGLYNYRFCLPKLSLLQGLRSRDIVAEIFLLQATVKEYR